MALIAADSNLGQIAYLRETTFGTTPSPFDATIARITASSFSANKGTVVSDELRADRMVGDLIETEFTSGGELSVELSLGGTYDDLFESALCGTYATTIDTTGSATFTNATGNILLTGAFTNAVVGQAIFVAGATNAVNNGWHIITTVTDADNVIVATTLTDEGPTASVNIYSKMVRNGTVKRSYSIEQYFSDTTDSFLFAGQRLGTMNWNAPAGDKVSGSFGFQGTTVTTSGAGSEVGTPTAATTTDVVNATSNVAKILVGGTALSCQVRAVNLSLDNALRNQMAIGNKYPCGIGIGRQNVSGSIEVYFQDLTMYDLMLNHTDVSLEWAFTDAAGNSVHFYIPRAKFASDNPSLDGIDTDIMENLEWQAIADSTGTYQVQICHAV